MLTGLFGRKTVESEMSFDSFTLTKIKSMYPEWTPSKTKEAIIAIVDISFLLHTMGAFPSCRSNSVAKIEHEMKNGLVKLDYNELTDSQRDDLKYLLASILPYDKNPISLSDKLSLTVPTITKLAEELASDPANAKITVTTNKTALPGLNKFSKKEKKALKAEIAKVYPTPCKDDNKRKLANQLSEELKIRTEAVIELMDQITADRNNQLKQKQQEEQQKSKQNEVKQKEITYESLSKTQRTQYKNTIKEMIKNNTATITAISNKLNISNTLAITLYEQSEHELSSMQANNNRAYDNVSRKERKEIKSKIKAMIEEGNTPTLAFIHTTFGVSNGCSKKLLKEVKDGLKQHEHAEIRSSQKICCDHKNLTKAERKEIKSKIRQHLSTKGLFTDSSRVEFAKSLNISTGVLQTLLNQVVLEDKPSNTQQEHTKALLNMYKSKIERILYEKGCVSIADLASALNTTQAAIKTCLTAMTPEGGPHPIEAATKAFRDRNVAEILRLKREEIHTDEDIMKMLKLNERQYNAFLESLYKA